MPARQYGSPQNLMRQPPGTSRQGASPYGRSNSADEPKTKKEDPSPSATVVVAFHKNSDLDVRPESQHHTLGARPYQASPGNHNHDGGTSPLILDGYVIVGSKANPSTVLPSIIACLVRLGAKDTTT